VTVAYAALLGINVLSILIPQLIRHIVDQGMRQRDTRLLGWSVSLLVALTLIKVGLSFVQNRWIETSSQNVAYDLRNAIHHKLASLSFSYHDRTETGQLLSRAIQDVEPAGPRCACSRVRCCCWARWWRWC
jgi:ATP-binding cassette subfamily B protein